MNEFYYNGLNISWKVTIEDSNFDWVAGDFGDFGDLGEWIWAGDGSRVAYFFGIVFYYVR